MSKQKLELNWIGKEKRPRLEPRILLEDPQKSYHAKYRVADGDIFDNRLIFGDNLLALKALEAEFTGKVKCVFIDPPYNTGSAFAHYDDGLEHSIWLGLMRDRLEIIRRLLSDDGSLWIMIDDNEAHYLKVLCDEVFGRNCSVANIAWRSSDAANNDAKTFSVDHNHILVYSRNPGWLTYPLPRTDDANAHYKNLDNDPNGPWFMGNLSSPKPRPNLRYIVKSPLGHDISPPANGWRWQQSTMTEMIETGEIVFSADGKRVIKKTYLKDQGGLSASTMWDDIDDTGHNRQAKYELKKLFPETSTSDLFATPKPERLIKKVLLIATKPNDIVLDSFAGSGTTGAVAHKMGRRWIMVELGEHCHTHIIPRLKKVIDGEDKGGITEAVNWQGGGGFRYCKLAPSLIINDRWGNPVVNPEYNAAHLAEALCKLEGFTYAPSETQWWQHGHSSERDFIYVTTQNLSVNQLQALSDEVGGEQSLLVCCAAFHSVTAAKAAERWLNLSLKKIPKMVLARCEWSQDDYSLNVANLPMAKVEKSEPAVEAIAGKLSKHKKVAPGQGGLFEENV
jgi:adenine-specific DNA-methyltransferase